MTVANIGHLDDDASSSKEGLPDGWTSAQLKDGLLIDVQPGFACGQNNRTGEGIAHLRPMNVNADGQIDLSIVKYVPETRADRDERLLRQSDVLFNNTNSPELVGKTSYYNLPEPRAFSNHMTRLRCNQSILAPLFCAIALHQKWREGYFRDVCSHHVSQSSVSRNILLETPILLPPLGEQKRIVAKVEQLLARVNAARERLAKILAILKRFRQSVLAAACSGRLTADWRENNTSVTSSELSIREILRLHQKQWVLEKGSAKKYKQPKSVRTERLPEVPESWKRVSSDALFSFVTSGSRGWAKYYSESGSTFIRIGNLDHDTITLDLSQIKRVNPPRGAERQRTRVQPGDILVSITADVGMTALVPDGIGEAYVNQHVAIARPVAGVYQPWLAWYLASAKGGQAQFQNLQRGATKIGLGLDDIRSVTVPFPPVEEQKEIAKRIEIFFKMADAIEKRVTAATAQAEKLTQAILAKAFRGELVSTEAELARLEGRLCEPASALLAKIEAQMKDVKPQRNRGRL
jgi:type I restriction enzyme S subunit